MDCKAKPPPANIDAALAAICRLEEKCAVIDVLEAAWDSDAVSDDAKLRVVIDIRRTMIDVILGLEELSSHDD